MMPATVAAASTIATAAYLGHLREDVDALKISMPVRCA